MNEKIVLPELEKELRKIGNVRIETWNNTVAVVIDDYPHIFVKPSPIEDCRDCAYVIATSLDLLYVVYCIARRYNIRGLFINTITEDGDLTSRAMLLCSDEKYDCCKPFVEQLNKMVFEYAKIETDCYIECISDKVCRERCVEEMCRKRGVDRELLRRLEII